MSLPSQAWSDIDFERDGKQVDHVFIPHSVNRSAYGNVAIPIVVLKRGAGPTILLTAGNHGDEFEGQIVACRIARRLEAADIRGRLIIIPGLNFPAAQNGTRVSPLDSGNLNRAFPGDPKGTVTQQIAYYLHTVLMPMADIVVDLHSGGSSLDYLPTAFTNLSGERNIDSAAIAAMRAFGAPMCMVFKDDGDTRRAFSSAHQNECIYLSTELGGTGCVNVDNSSFSYAGTVRVLKHFGLLTGDTVLQPIRNAQRDPLRAGARIAPTSDATVAGIFEPSFKLGDEVRAGALAGFAYRPGAADFRARAFLFQGGWLCHLPALSGAGAGGRLHRPHGDRFRRFPVVNIEAAAGEFVRSFSQTDLVLYAGTNLPCPPQAACNPEALGMMPVIGSRADKQQPNVGLLAEIEVAAAAMLCGIFGGEFAEARFLSCSRQILPCSSRF